MLIIWDKPWRLDNNNNKNITTTTTWQQRQLGNNDDTWFDCSIKVKQVKIMVLGCLLKLFETPKIKFVFKMSIFKTTAFDDETSAQNWTNYTFCTIKFRLNPMRILNRHCFVKLTNILQTAFSSISYSQKIKNTNWKYRKASKNNFELKSQL